MKTSAVIRIVSWSVVALLLLGFLICGINGTLPFFAFNVGTTFSYSDSDKYTVGGGSSAAADVHSIEVNWVSGGVRILEHDGPDIVFREEGSEHLGERDQMRYYLKNGRLIIQFCDSRHTFRRLNDTDKRLTIEVPRGHKLSELQVDIVSGGVEVSGVSAADMGIESVSGSVNLSGLSADRLDAETVSGGLTLQDVAASSVSAESVNGRMQLTGAFAQVRCTTVSGGLTVSPGDNIAGIEAESLSGRVEIYLPENIDGFIVNYESLSGTVACDFPAQAGRNSITYGNGRAVFNIESVSGGVQILMV